tara:strand:- start:16792 stop:17091 length:300 start_codon:yes stop_codon:yes gene_type:complete
MDIKFTNNEEVEDIVNNPAIKEPVVKNTELKNILVDYIGEKENPKDGNVTVEMIVEIMAKEFPEFLLVLAEENYIRGYHQALEDIDEGMKIAQENEEQY